MTLARQAPPLVLALLLWCVAAIALRHCPPIEPLPVIAEGRS